MLKRKTDLSGIGAVLAISVYVAMFGLIVLNLIAVIHGVLVTGLTTGQIIAVILWGVVRYILIAIGTAIGVSIAVLIGALLS